MPSPEILVLGIPYEGKGNFLHGTSAAPPKIRWALESIEIYSPYQNRLLPDYKDLGDLLIKMGNPRETLEEISETLKSQLNPNRRALFLGGDHTITWATVMAYLEIYSDLRVIHLDAHLDRRDIYEGERFNHATVIKRIEDKIGAPGVFSLGVRSVAPSEKAEYLKEVYKNLPLVLEKVKDKPIYLTLDVDVMDPSEFPAVGNPEPGGPSFREILDSLLLLKGKLVGADIVEVNPNACKCHYSLVTAAVLMREILILLENEPKSSGEI